MSLSILNYGHDPLLLRTRDLLLNHEGFRVFTAANCAEALRFLAAQEIDLLLTCHSLSEPEFQSILAAVHELEQPPRVLALVTNPKPEKASAEYAVFNIFDGPETFLAAVHGLIAPDGPPLPQTGRSHPMAGLTGTVRWFNNAKGYGFLGRDDGGPDVFTHYSAIEKTGYKTLKEGEPVSFDIVKGEKGLQADKVVPLNGHREDHAQGLHASAPVVS